MKKRKVRLTPSDLLNKGAKPSTYFAELRKALESEYELARDEEDELRRLQDWNVIAEEPVEPEE